MKQEIKELSEKYKLNPLDIRRLNTELELTRLKLEYSIFKAKKERLSLYDSLVFYAGLKRFTQRLNKKSFETLKINLKKTNIKDLNEQKINKISSELFLKSDYTKNICKHVSPEYCFNYDLWKNTNLNIHFANATIPKNPLKGKEIGKRKAELRRIALIIKRKHPYLKGIFSASWMWNLNVFKEFMPKEFNKSLKEFKENEFYSLGHWGQFYRSDGNLNQERIDQFRKNWKFPLKILFGKCETKYFLDKYLKEER